MSEKKIRLGKKVAKSIANKDKGGGGFLSLPEGVKMFKEKVDSKVLLDILPYEVTDAVHMDKDEDGYPNKGDLWWRRPLKVHYGVGVNNKKMVCPTTFGKPCPICEYIRQEELEKEDYNKLRPKDRVVYAVIPINNKDYDEEIHIWEIAYANFQDRLELEMEDDPETLGEFPNLEGGYTLRVKFTKKTMGKNNFAAATKIDFEERDEDYNESILEDVPNLDDIIVVHSYEDIYQAFYGMPIGEDETVPDDEQDEESESKKKTSSKKKKKTVAKSAEKEEEINDEGDDEDDNGDEKEAKSTTSSRKRKTTGKSSSKTATKPTKKEESKEEEGNDQECPHGLEFGKDWDSDDVCEDCDKWEECGDKYKEKYK